jgi:surface antigen
VLGTWRYGIRTVQSLNQEISNKFDDVNIRRQRWYKRLFATKRNRRRTIRYTLLVSNVALLVLAIAFVTQSPDTSRSATPALSARSEEAIANPLDELSSADIAVHVARATRLPESTSVTNLADSVSKQLTVAASDNIVSSKPQVIATGLPSREDISIHTVKKGETVASIATNYGITSDTVRWSNDITGEVSPGDKLTISPVDGLVYTVLASDTIDDIASRFSADKEKLIAINDLESGGLPVGEKIIVPDGVKPDPVSSTSSSSYSAYSSGSSLSFGNAPIYGYNGYDPGWCTWYAASRVSVPINWGNANTWDEGARRSGWTVSSVPVVGAIAQTSVGWAGHVGVVDAVKQVNGQYFIKYSDMNGLAGFGRVGYSDWVPANSRYENFIYR